MTREEAIEILEKYKTESEEDYYVKRAEALEMAIKALSSSEKPNKWIPVSERLPEKNGEYLVTVKATIKGVSNYILHCNFGLNLYKVDEYDFVERRGVAGFYKYDSEYGYYEITEVIAWYELPEPYKASPTGAESEDKE